MADANVKKDIINMINLAQKCDFTDRNKVEQLYITAVKQQVFRTEYGDKFLERCKDIFIDNPHSNKCIVCSVYKARNGVVCDNCLAKSGVAKARPAVPATDSKQSFSSAGRQQPAISAGRPVDLKNRQDIAKPAAIKLRSLFSEVFKKHTYEESAEIFITGRSTPVLPETEAAASWPKPWLFSRILAIFLIFSVLAYLGTVYLGMEKAIPSLIFFGATALPLAVLVFFFETNLPKNVSIYEVIKMFFIGGTVSLILNLSIPVFFPAEELTNTTIILLSLSEEVVKLVIIALFIQKTNARYLLSGLLIGAAFGAGFTIFEATSQIFHAFAIGDGQIKTLISLILAHDGSSLGRHLAWSAITGAGLAAANRYYRFKLKNFIAPRFLKCFLLTCLLHATWDSSFMADFINIKRALLTLIAWTAIIILLYTGLKQIERKIEKTFIRQKDEWEPLDN